MKFSKKSEYAFRALVSMARQPTALHTIPKISGEAGIPPKFLEQILLSLRQGGLLESRRGAHGGYTFQRPPQVISLAEVVQIVEGRDENSGSPPAPCDNAVDIFLGRIESEVTEQLRKTTVEDLLLLGQQSAGAHFDI
jgi:Rrf2 family protein